MSEDRKSEKPVDTGRGVNGTDTEKKPGSSRMGALLLIVVGLIVLAIVLYAVSVARSMKTGVTGNKVEEKLQALPESEIAPEIKTVELPGKVALELVKVEAGSFEMSAKDKSNFSDEKPHQVTLENDFYLGRTEVTQAQYQAVMGADPSKFKGGDLPVEQVTWYDAMEFCKKLNETGMAPSGWMFTLPTETQWEYAARGGSKNRGCKFSGSDELEEVGWYGDSGKSKDKGKAKDKDKEEAVTENKGTTHPAAQKKANELGLYDMSGNVWEWTLDDYVGDSSAAKAEERLVISSEEKRAANIKVGEPCPHCGQIVGEPKRIFCQYRTVRGGSWSKGERYCRNAQRYYYNAAFRFSNIGFRVALVKMTPAEVAQAAIDALKRQDLDAVVALSHGKAQAELKKHVAIFAELKKAAAAGDEAKKAQLAQVQSILERVSIEIKSGNIDAELASFDVARTLDGKTKVDKMYLRKINGVWKLVDESEYAPAK